MALSLVWNTLNSYATEQQPWVRAESRSPYVVLEAMRISLPYLAPVMPHYTSILSAFLGADSIPSSEFRLQGSLRLNLTLRQQLRITTLRAKDLDVA